MGIEKLIQTIEVKENGRLDELHAKAFEELKEVTGYSGSQEISSINDFFVLYQPGMLHSKDKTNKIIGVKIDYVVNSAVESSEKNTRKAAGSSCAGPYKSW